MSTITQTSPVLTSTSFRSTWPEQADRPARAADRIDRRGRGVLRLSVAVAAALAGCAAGSWVSGSLLTAQLLSSAAGLCGGLVIWLLSRQVRLERREHAVALARADRENVELLRRQTAAHLADYRAQQERYERRLAATTDCMHQLVGR